MKKNVEIVDDSNIDWEQRRYEIAKEMLPVTSEWRTIYDIRIGRTEAAVRAVAYADALIEELLSSSYKCNFLVQD